MRYFKKLVGTKCYLSPVNLDDAETYTAWLNDLEVTRTLDAAGHSFSLSGERRQLEKLVDDHVYGIVDLETDALVGNVGLTGIDQLHRTCSIGVFIGNKAYWGQGYGPEAMRLLLGYTFDYLNMHSVRLSLFDFNARGLAAYRKLGFKEAGRWREALFREGRFHDVIMMDLLEEEFRDDNGAPRA
jgi:RimJ/RimL family protein N-acetyltransferase